VVRELEDAGGPRAGRLAAELAKAAEAYAEDRYLDALRITTRLVRVAPGSAAVRELHGLTCYRLGRWRQALSHLRTAAELTGGDVSQLPVVMDCHRALGQHREVAARFEELRQASPDADLLAEGRLVLAGDLADRGDLGAAVALLVEAGGMRRRANPAARHLRQWYLLGDLLERSGDLAGARELFARVVAADPDLADVAARLEALGGPPGTVRTRRGRRPAEDRTLGELARRP
jgi:tetratricopeptide (TPR) repeat protein